MGATERAMALKSELEASLLRLSVMATFLIAGLGVVFGLVARSNAIIFDGLLSLIDAAVTWLMLIVARLVTIESSRRFQYGYWHLEPLVVGLKASLLLILIAFGFLGAVQSLLSGGYMPELGIAIAYSVLAVLICFGTWFWLSRHNARIGSELVRVDARAWLTSALITTALLAAFVAARAALGTAHAWAVPYMDPAVLALVSLAILPVPAADAVRAFRDIFGIVPPALDARVRQVMDRFIAAHGFTAYESYVTKTGRARFIEISILAPPDMPAKTIPYFDALRAEIGEAIGEAGPDRWLTISFTSDPAQL
jgi:predicted Co/Zn/Cd cation transporter (cation efflux family)